jgi:hypothetical protein
MPALAFRMVPATRSNRLQSRIVANQFVYHATELFFPIEKCRFAVTCRWSGVLRFTGTSDASKAS